MCVSVCLHIFVLFHSFLSFFFLHSLVRWIHFRKLSFYYLRLRFTAIRTKITKCLIHSRFGILESTLNKPLSLSPPRMHSHTHTRTCSSSSPTLVAYSNLFIYFVMYLGFRLLIAAHYLVCSLVQLLLLHIYFHKYEYLTTHSAMYEGYRYVHSRVHGISTNKQWTVKMWCGGITTFIFSSRRHTWKGGIETSVCDKNTVFSVDTIFTFQRTGFVNTST